MEPYVSCCLTLTLDRPGDVARKQRYVCCVDIPDKAVEELRRYEKVARMPLRVMTHQLPPEAARESFQERMARAEETLRVYAGASWVVTRAAALRPGLRGHGGAGAVFVQQRL